MADEVPDFRVPVERYFCEYPNYPDVPPIAVHTPQVEFDESVKEVIVQQYSGNEANKVWVLDEPERLTKVDIGHPLGNLFADAHGVVVRNPPAEEASSLGYQRGDRVWVEDIGRGDRKDEDSFIQVINLRTFKSVTVCITDICWVPSYVHIDEDKPQLLSVCGAWKDRRDDQRWKWKDRVCVIVRPDNPGEPLCRQVTIDKFPGTMKRRATKRRRCTRIPPASWKPIKDTETKRRLFGTMWKELVKLPKRPVASDLDSVASRRGSPTTVITAEPKADRTDQGPEEAGGDIVATDTSGVKRMHGYGYLLWMAPDPVPDPADEEKMRLKVST
jgi:hypothetical protein